MGEAAEASDQDTERAITAAHHAFSSWAGLTAGKRALFLRRLYDLLLDYQVDLANLLTSEQGKPLHEATGEIQIAADYLLWYAEEARRVYGEIIPASSTQKRLLVLNQPVGPAALITPWNFPLSMITRKAAPALAAGCTVVIKPSEKTPLTAVALALLVEQAGFPKGVVNLVTSSQPAVVGDRFLADERIRKISFTGSTAVGKRLMAGAAGRVQRLSLELGGSAPFLVFADADLSAAVQGAVQSKFRNAGQTCICANRFLVEESVAEEFTSRLAQAVRDLRLGRGTDHGVDVGPLIDRQAMTKVEAHVQDAMALGAQLICGGIPETGLGGGYFFPPTVLYGVTNDMRVVREETFGPVAPVQVFVHEGEAIRLANTSPYGLAAYVYTRDLDRAIRVAEKLEYGIVGLNDAVPTTVEAPFGGLKESGMGREGGREGIRAYLETKFVSIGLHGQR